jgi:hypothetical protein
MNVNKPKSIQEVQTQMLQDQIDSIKEQFQQLDRLDVRTVPENIFVHHFLPVFAGEKKENVQETVAMWVNIAGSNFHPVNVVNNQGQVVAQVPPLQNNKALDPSKSTSNLAYAVKESRAKAELSPIGAQAMLTNQLSSKLDNMTQDFTSKNKPLEDMWMDLLNKYGKGPDSKKDNKGNQDDLGDPFGF